MSESVVESVRALNGRTFRRKTDRYALRMFGKAAANKASAALRATGASATIERKGKGYIVHVTEYGDWEKVKRGKDGAK